MSEPAHRAAAVAILIVDDRPENLAALSAVLSSDEYRLVTATSGTEALRCLLRETFALILLDVVMPEMDGIELATLIRQRDPERHTPIIFLTAAGNDASFLHKGYLAGAVDYLCKPIDADVVRAKVSVFVDLYRKSEEIKRQGELLRQAEQRERAHQIRELRATTQKRYRNLADAIPAIVWTATPDGAFDYCNHRWVEFTASEATQADGWGWLSAVHPDDRERCRAGWHACVATGANFDVECRLRRFDGEYFWHLGRALPERGHDGQIVAWLGTYTDIDAQKQSQAALDQFRATLDAVLDAVWIFDPLDLRFQDVNQGACVQLDVPRDALLATGPLDYMPAFDRESFRTLLQPLVDGTRDVLTVETTERRSGGSEHPVELSLQHIALPGERARFVAIVRDITDRRAAEEERARLYRDAQAAIRARDEFLSIASHELKTPLTALQLQVKNLLRLAARETGGTIASDRLAPKLETIDRSAIRLTRLIDNLLDISRITAGRIDLDIDDVDLSTVVREIADRAREDLARAGCTLAVHCAGPVVGRWDSLRLEQIMTNLLSNAIKYGAGKPVEIRVETVARQARVVVRDEGIGIAPQDQARIFQRFERAVSERHYSGFGLGLWIVRQIVVALGGDIRVESTPGAGSSFTVELPLDGAVRSSFPSPEPDPLLAANTSRDSGPPASAPSGIVAAARSAVESN